VCSTGRELQMAWNTCAIGDRVPRRGNWFTQLIGRVVLYVLGWRIDVSRLPNIPKMVVVGAPHTSNWEFIMTVLLILSLRMNINWMGKHTMFAWPFGSLLRWLGGLPIDRTCKNDVTAATVREFARRSHFCCAIMVEGTRDVVTNWKSGFWYIARGADVPVVPVIFDYGRRVLSFGPAYELTDDLVRDTYNLQLPFRDVIAKNPELQLALPVDPAVTRATMLREKERLEAREQADRERSDHESQQYEVDTSESLAKAPTTAATSMHTTTTTTTTMKPLPLVSNL